MPKSLGGRLAAQPVAAAQPSPSLFLFPGDKENRPARGSSRTHSLRLCATLRSEPLAPGPVPVVPGAWPTGRYWPCELNPLGALDYSQGAQDSGTWIRRGLYDKSASREGWNLRLWLLAWCTPGLPATCPATNSPAQETDGPELPLPT